MLDRTIDSDLIRSLKEHGNTVVPSAALKRWSAKTIENGLSEILGEVVFITEFYSDDNEVHYIAHTMKDPTLSGNDRRKYGK